MAAEGGAGCEVQRRIDESSNTVIASASEAIHFGA
jgi:hypothetical protein